MSDASPEVARAAVDLLNAATKAAGVDLDVDAAVAVADELVRRVTELVDGHAKAHAAAAGEAAATKITTLAEAEESAKKR